MRKFFLFMLIFFTSFFTFAQTVKVGVLNGPSGIPMAHFMRTNSNIQNLKLQYEVFAQANQLLPKLVKGEIDLGFLPPNVAAKVYNINNGAVVMAAVTGNGMLTLITKDKNIKTFADLKGKCVTVAGQGATPDFMFRYLLKENNISVGKGAKKVELDFSVANANIVPSLMLNKINYALVPEPFATLACAKDSNVIRAIDIQQEFKKINKTQEYPMTVIVVNKKFAESYEQIVKAFLENYKQSYLWTIENPEQAGVLVEKYQIGLTKEVASLAIPNAAFTFKTSEQAKESVESLLKIFLEFDKTSIGEKLPDEKFYF